MKWRQSGAIALSIILLLAALAGCRQQAGPEPLPEQPEQPEQPELPPSQPAAPEPEKQPEPEENIEPEAPKEDSFSFADLPDSLYFSSGAGAWYSSLSVEADGSFSGQYSDTDMGDFSDDYPQGTQYLCAFSGQLAQPEKINAYTYSTSLTSLTWDPPDQVTIRDGTRFITSGPVGLENSERLLIYLPQAPVSQLPEEFLCWTHIDDSQETLGMYGIYNETEGTAFVGG